MTGLESCFCVSLVLGFGAILGVVLTVVLLKMPSAKGRQQAWRDFARKHGLQLHSSAFKGIWLTGKVSGFDVKVSAYALGRAHVRTYHVVELRGITQGHKEEVGNTRVHPDGRVVTEYLSTNPNCLQAVLDEALQVARRYTEQ